MKNPWPFLGILTMLVCATASLAAPRVHDPSTIVRCGDEYWLFATGNGIPAWHSRDLVTWTPGPRVSPAFPPLVPEIGGRQGSYFWAPDVINLKGRYFVYYSISKWGAQTSTIALATNSTLDPASPDYRWYDRGVVVHSTAQDDFNAIDPSVMLDGDGRLWMAFGSFWSGIKVVELNPNTGLRKAGAPLHAVAWAKEIEAACLISHGGEYFLFVNWGRCCRGIHSTYEIRVGRSAKITGPYRDRNGVDLMAGGGSLFLGNEGPRIGPGHAALLREGENEWLSYHFYDADDHGTPSLGLRKLLWGEDGWPIPGKTVQTAVAPKAGRVPFRSLALEGFEIGGGLRLGRTGSGLLSAEVRRGLTCDALERSVESGRSGAPAFGSDL